jgi:hypothetical protein
MDLREDRAYWVQWRGGVARRDGQPFDPSDESLTAYLSVLTAALSQRSDLDHPAVAVANARVWLTSSVRAPSEGVAVDKVKVAFTEVLATFGNGSLPASEHRSWSVFTLESEPTVVREFVAA